MKCMACLAARRLMCECLARSLRSCISCSQSISSSRVHSRWGSSSRTTRLTCGRVIKGIFSPRLVADATRTLRPTTP